MRAASALGPSLSGVLSRWNPVQRERHRHFPMVHSPGRESLESGAVACPAGALFSPSLSVVWRAGNLASACILHC